MINRSDTAWKDANYAQIWEYLRDDFELDERFESLDFKLNIIQVCSISSSSIFHVLSHPDTDYVDHILYLLVKCAFIKGMTS